MPSLRFRLRAAATSADPCTGARKARHRSGADSPRGIDYGQSGRAHVQFWRSTRRFRLAAPARPARSAKDVIRATAVNGSSFRYASLRAACGVPSMNRRRKVTGSFGKLHITKYISTFHSPPTTAMGEGVVTYGGLYQPLFARSSAAASASPGSRGFGARSTPFPRRSIRMLNTTSLE